MKKILLCADLHAGIRTWGVDRRDELLLALSQIYDVARDFNVDALFALGDIFHSFRYPGEDVVLPIAKFFSEVLSLPAKPFIYLLKGNHDWSGIRIWELFQGDGRFVFVDDVSFVTLGDMVIFLVPYLRRHDLPKGMEIEEFLKVRWKDAPKGSIRLCFAHMALEGTPLSLSEITLPERILVDFEIDKTICGHIHRHYKVKGKSSSIYYVGSPIRLDFAEEGNDLGVYVVDERADIIDVPLQGKSLVTLEYDDEAEASSKLCESLDKVAKDAYVRVVLNRSALPVSQLLDKFRLLTDDRIVAVSVNDGILQTTSSSQDPFDVLGLWKRFIDNQDEDDATKEILKAIGESLLLGKDPSTMWSELKSFFETDEQE